MRSKMLVMAATAAFAFGLARAQEGNAKSGDYKPDPALNAEVEAAVRDNVDAFNVPPGKTFDIDRVMKLYAEGDKYLMYDFMVPQEWTGHGLRQHFIDVISQYPATIDVSDIRVHACDTVAFATSIQRAHGTGPNGKSYNIRFRVTDGLVKQNGKWLWVHQHVSLPINWTTGQVVYDAKKDDARPRAP